MKLTDLDARFLRILPPDPEMPGRRVYQQTTELAGADGIEFLCPKCALKNGGPVGTHAVRCWAPHVPQDHYPKPGRWPMAGTGLHDVTLNPSIQINGGPTCDAHFWVRDGAIVDLT